MEQIISRLSEIETAATAIMEDADRQKKVLSQEMENRCKEFDIALERETDEQIAKIRQNLEKEKDARLASLREDTDAAFRSLDSYYEKNHERLSRQLFKQIVQ